MIKMLNQTTFNFFKFFIKVRKSYLFSNLFNLIYI